MTNRIQPPSGWEARWGAGGAHEDYVRRELERRGMTVDSYGQGLFGESTRRLLKRTKSRLRWDPDFVVTWGQSVCLVDAKASMRGEDADRYTISRDALIAGLKLAFDWDMPLYYIFSNLGIATPIDVMRYCRLTSIGEIRGSYVSFGAELPGHLDDVFGPPEDGAAGVVAIRPAA